MENSAISEMDPIQEMMWQEVGKEKKKAHFLK